MVKYLRKTKKYGKAKKSKIAKTKKTKRTQRHHKKYSTRKSKGGMEGERRKRRFDDVEDEDVDVLAGQFAAVGVKPEALRERQVAKKSRSRREQIAAEEQEQEQPVQHHGVALGNEMDDEHELAADPEELNFEVMGLHDTD